MSAGGFEAALIAAMAEMANPAKSNTATVPTKNGGKYTYKYESLDQVLACVRPALIDHGIGLTQSVRHVEGRGYVLETRVFDGDGNSMVMDERPMVATQDAQAAGSWETYMRRYALRCAFGLCGEDDDGAQAKRKTPPPSPLGADPTAAGARRKKMLVRCAELSAKCIENGMNVGATEKYMQAHFLVNEISELSDEQLVEFGKYLSQMEEQSRHLKEEEK